jgi:hypothetical protein
MIFSMPDTLFLFISPHILLLKFLYCFAWYENILEYMDQGSIRL